MIKVPAKHKRSIETELKRFIPIFSSLAAKGKASSEDDARIILNDVMSYVLGYDKYNELKTEQRDRNCRLDYLVTINESSKRKRNKADFVVEAKAVHVELNQSHVDQTLTYCLTAGLDYFFLTNVVKWQLFKVKRSKKKPEANLIYEVSFNVDNSAESLAEDFYVFSKASYLAGDWDKISDHAMATNESDIVAVLLSDRIIKRVCKQLEEIHGAKVSEEAVKDIIENKIVKSEVSEVNKSLLKKLNAKPAKSQKPVKVEVSELAVVSEATSADVEKNGDNTSIGKTA